MEKIASFQFKKELEKKEDKSMLRKKKRIKIFFLIILILLIVFFGAGFTSIKPALSAYYSAMRGKDTIFLAQKALEAQKLSAATLALRYAHEDFSNSKKSLDRLFWTRFVPLVGRQYSAVDRLLTSGIHISSALLLIAETAEGIISPIQFKEVTTFSGITSSQKREILKNFFESTPAFEEALSKIEQAEKEIEKIPSFFVLSKISDAKDQIAARLPQAKQFLEKAKVLTKLLPPALGYPKEQVYFFMFQNNAELRPTGGFFGTYGVLKVKDGEIIELKTEDTYTLDNRADIQVTPPWQFPRLVHPALKTWYLRDSNWAPDFPETAEKALWFYREEGGEEKHFDGVVAITPTFIEYLLELTGPIKIIGHPKEFTHENVIDLIQYHVEKRFVELGLKEEFRKNIIGELANILVKKIFSLPRDRWFDLVLIFQKSLNEKHILLYSKQPDVQKIIEKEGWAGKIETTEGDYLLIVDANMASLKTDEYVDREIDYEINLNKNEKAEVKLSITYKNNAPGFSWKTTRYRSWNRIYVPKDAELVNIFGNEKGAQYYDRPGKTFEINHEFGKTSFGTFISIEPKEEKTLIYEYKLPRQLTQKLKKEYQLLVQKQPGTINPKLNISLFSYVPIKSFSPEEGVLLENNKKVEFKTDLLVDREFRVGF